MEPGTALRETRRAARLSQQQVAARSGIPQSAIARIESGRVVPRVDTFERLLTACDSSIEVRRKLGVGIDRTVMRELLRLSPSERLQYAVGASRSLHALRSKLRRVK